MATPTSSASNAQPGANGSPASSADPRDPVASRDPAAARDPRPRIYDGDGDALMQKGPRDLGERLSLIPDASPSRTPDPTRRIRILWGQYLLEDVIQGRYRTLVCAVNAQDNSSGIISQLARLLPTSQWDEASITAYARQFTGPGRTERARVLKYDMDMVEVLAVLRPLHRARLTLEDLRAAFGIAVEMIAHKPGRTPSASVSFLGARANALADADGREPTFEAVLRTMHDAGYDGDVYPSPAMWDAQGVGLFARYPFPPALEQLRQGGF